MARRQVLILYHGSLLAQGIESLLRKEKGLDIACVRVEKEAEDAGYAIGLAPDVIILDACDLKGQARLSILKLLEEHPRAKVICLNPEDGNVEVYYKDHRVATKREELVEAIRSA